MAGVQEDADFYQFWSADDLSPEIDLQQGVSLAFFNAFYQTYILPHGPDTRADDALRLAVRLANKHGKTRLTQLFPRAVGPPTFYLSHVGEQRLGEVVQALNEHLSDKDAAKGVPVVALFQHSVPAV
jgi:hypothetical protein